MHDIFLSYSRTDTEIMQKVKQTFLDADFTVLDTVFENRDTDDWIIATEKGITGTEVFVFILSPDALKSYWVQTVFDLINHRRRTSKPIYLILARGDKQETIPEGYVNHTVFDIRDKQNFNSVMKRLKVVIRRILPEVTFGPTEYFALASLAQQADKPGDSYSVDEIQLSRQFREAKHITTEIYFKYQQGQIDEEERDTEAQKAMVQDLEGVLWSYGYEEERWYYFEDEVEFGSVLRGWRRGIPPVPLDLE